MKFTTPCFIRIEDTEKRKELIEWLRGIGYSYSNKDKDLPYSFIFCHTKGYFWTSPFNAAEDPYMPIDCKNNIDLFKALAAMNDENDREQWFKNRYTGEMVLCEKVRIMLMNGIYAPYYDKATTNEIIEHFKTK